MQLLTEQQIAFFNAFGFVVLPKLMAEEIGWITEEFEGVFTDRNIQHDESKRDCIVPFIDQRRKFCTLLDHPKIAGVAASLIGPDFNYLGGDGNYYTGDTNWHSDGFHNVGKFLKIAFYLDPVARDTGALRVIPGSHLIEAKPHWHASNPWRAMELWGIEPRDVPATALESQPGDVVAFNHNLYHASFGGSVRRRMFTLNLCRHCDTPEEITDLKNFISGAARFWIDHTHSDLMKETASPERMTHLRQVMDNEGHLAELTARARETQAEPARG